MDTELIVFLGLSLALFPFGVMCLLKPEKFTWLPVYRTYEKLLNEKAALMITRFSAGLGSIGLSVVLFLSTTGLV